MKLKYVGGIAIAATLFSSAAFAADVVVPEVIPVFSWTGAYVGVNLGYGGDKAKHSFDISQTWWEGEISHTDHMNGNLDFRSSGFLGGVQAGYNWQMDQWVLGVETDFQGANIKGEGSFDLSDDFGNSISGSVGTKLDWYGTLRARAGVLATERFLVYATGGLAYGRTKSFIDVDAPGFNFHESRSKTKAGWTIGAGAEYAITDHLTFKTEYLYTDLGNSNVFDGDIAEGTHLSIDRKFKFNTVRAGLNYKF
ncbi:outer membrane immunogenic protein [Mesorhizobium soli]|uniref:outer membrane protein n=1 Tax=Pseudaminobacter soli (ex Li et al. 2025) TaxID=1295366 RepID=UPI0024768B9D|nr:porin family protein [Mesorhizobium soli]MDH6231127.1 outer membrane immunogenic protein [Mesorhizobium soli]